MARDARRSAPRRGLSVADALAALAMIDRSVLAFCASAPEAVTALGGGTVPKARAWMQSLCQMTCIGPVPRLTEEAWEACAHEHAERQRESRLNTCGGVAVGRRPGPEGSLPTQDRAGRLEVHR